MPRMTGKQRRFLLRCSLIFLSFCLIKCLSALSVQATEDNPNYLPLIYKDYDPSWQWSTAITVELTPMPYHDPLVVVDHQQQLHIFWDTLKAPHFIYHTFLGAFGWSATEPITQTLGTSTLQYPPVVGPDGTIHLVWQNDLGSGVEARYRLLHAQFDGINWSPETVLYQNVHGSVDGLPYLDEQNRLQILSDYSNLVTRQFLQFTQTTGGWSTSVIGDPPKGHALSVAAWTPTRQGGIHFYADGFTNGLYHTYWLNGTFPAQSQSFSGKLWGRHTQGDGNSNLHTYWLGPVPVPGGTVQGLTDQCLANTLTWREPQVLSHQQAVHGQFVTATDQQSQVAFAWIEDYRHMRLALWRGCTLTDEKEIPFTNVRDLSLSSMLLSQEPHQFCVLAQSRSPSRYTVLCANIYR